MVAWSQARPMSKVDLRTAREDDYPAIAVALQTWWTMPGFESEAGARERAALVPRLWLQHFSGTSSVAELKSRLVGFLIGLLSPDRHDEGYIHFVGVAPDVRGVGIGRSLYERFFDVCRQAGRKHVRCVTSPRNLSSIAFHATMGFDAEQGTEGTGTVLAKIDYDGPGVHRVAFVRRI
jgi:ribosomal protein S18 acetylase RimI-like enzyme